MEYYIKIDDEYSEIEQISYNGLRLQLMKSSYPLVIKNGYKHYIYCDEEINLSKSIVPIYMFKSIEYENLPVAYITYFLRLGKGE